ncbi:TonB-dependent receptor [Proteobacteria bacterium 005FR1]|nr:TonB-dependent receptor [Proteobacteria bacterium 005FR1]
MNTRSRFLKTPLALAIGPVALLVSAAPLAQQAQTVIEEVVVTGSRGAPRTALDSTAPVDVFSATDFQDQGTADLNDLLRNLVPSYNVDTQDINDSNSLVRPATLRGLPADDTLVMVNGKRRHRSAAVQFGRDGTHFPDVAQIPAIALKQVEVLRDGASAQYGSDAIAGVINFILKENRDGFSSEVKTGKYTETNDGQLTYVAANMGLPLGEGGFASVSFDLTRQEHSDRSIQRGDAQAIYDAGNPHIRFNAQRQGLPDSDITNVFINTGVELGPSQELYSFGGYSQKDVELGFYFRNPENRNGIFTTTNDAGEKIQLFIDTTDDSSASCPEIPVGVDPVTGVTSSVAAREYGLSDPNCFTFLERHPGGYTPTFGANVSDISNVTGIRGQLKSGTSYDVSLGLGRSEVDYFIENTSNSSMGPDSPRSFRPGVYTTLENNVNVDLVTPVDVDWLYSALNVAYGLEWRREVFEVGSTDEYSYLVGEYANQGTNVGSDGFQGFGPNQQGEWDRKNWGFYVDVEADITERLLMGTALRYENFYNTFGDTTNGKLSARYRVTDTVNLRSTVSTGFRAPSPGQANISNISTGVDNGIPQAEGQIPPTNPISRLFGGTELQPEKSTNFSLGLTAQVGGLDLSVDYYHIQLKDRILNSSQFAITPEVARQLQESGISGAGSIVEFSYYTNDMDTTNQGVEIVGSWSQDWEDYGTTQWQASWAWKKQELDDFTPSLLSRAAELDLTETIPQNRANLRANHLLGNWRFTLGANFYDEYLEVPSSRDPSRDYWVGSATIFSGEVAYTYNQRYTFILGADNMFNRMPEEIRPQDTSSGTSNRYLTSGAFSPNGAFWYGRFKIDL